MVVLSSILMGGGIAKGQVQQVTGGLLTPFDSCVFQTDTFHGNTYVEYFFVSDATSFELTVQGREYVKFPVVFEKMLVYNRNDSLIDQFNINQISWNQPFTVPTIGDTFIIRLETNNPPPWYEFDICLKRFEPEGYADFTFHNPDPCVIGDEYFTNSSHCYHCSNFYSIWYINGVEVLATPLLVSPDLSTYPNGTYQVELCIYCCATSYPSPPQNFSPVCTSYTINLYNEDAPTIDIIENDLTICQGEYCFHDITTNDEDNLVQWDVYQEIGGVYTNIWGATSTSNSEFCYQFLSVGYYMVIAEASNICGTASETLYVEVVPPSADFTWEGICVGTDICFTELAECEEFWHWDFGDGSTSTQQNPCHTYTAAGTYLVTLTVDQVGTSVTYPVQVIDAIQPVITGDEYACDPLSHYEVSPTGAFTQIGWAVNNPSGWVSTTPPDEFDVAWPSNTGGMVYVQTTDVNGCVAEGQYTVYDCCIGPLPQFNFHDETFDSQAPVVYNNENIYFSGTNIYISSGAPVDYTYNGCNLYFATNTKLIIDKDAKVKFDENCHLMSCDGVMWDGIYIKEGGELEVTGSSIIQDAKNAVVSQRGGKYLIHNAVLDRNYYHLVVRRFSNTHPGEIYNTKLSCTSQLLPQNPIIPYATQTRFAISAYRVNGIQFGNPQSPQFKNTIENCDVGIYCLNSAVEVYNNDFKNIFVPFNIPISEKKGFGIFAEKQLQIGAPVSSLIVGGSGNLPGAPHFKPNTFTDVTNGVYTYQYQNIEIKNNDFSLQSSSGLASHAIQIDEFVHFQGNKRIDFNTIENYRSGIVLNNVENIYVENNDISDFYIPGYGGLSYGIHVISGSYVYVLGNDIENAFISDRTKGITVSTSPSSVVQCNTIKNMGTSIHLRGTMLPFTLRQNRMQNGIDALMFSYATIGTQGTAGNPQGNRWIGNFSGCQTLMDGSYGSNSIFYCKNGSTTTPSNNCLQSGGTVFSYISTNANSWPGCMQIIPVAPNAASLYSIANDQIGFGQYEQENKWLARKQALLKINRESLSGDPLLDQFTLSQQNTGTAITQNIEDTLPAGLNDAQAMNLSLNAQFSNEIARKTVNNAFFLKESDTLSDPTQFIINAVLRDSLKWVAQQCPYEFGEAVYQARMFLAFIDTTAYQNLCESDFDIQGEKSVSNVLINSEKIRVSPNPFDNYITIEFKETTKSNTKGEIYDVAGRLVLSFEIPAESTLFVVETDKLTNGAFYIKLWNNNEELYFSKILK